MGIHHETTDPAADAAPRAPARPGRAIPLRHWLLLALALVTLSAPVLATSTAAATALARPVTGAQLRAAAPHELPDAGTTLPVALGLLGLAVMGCRPQELAQ